MRIRAPDQAERTPHPTDEHPRRRLAGAASRTIELHSFFDGPLGLDPLGPPPFDDHRWFMPAHPAATPRPVSPRGRQTAIGPDVGLLGPRDASGEGGIVHNTRRKRR